MSMNKQILKSNQCYEISQADINSKLTVGLGWDVAQEAEGIDLDASCIMLKNDGSYEVIYYNHLISQNESVQHSGDNLTGAGEGDDEQIVVYLEKIPKDVLQLIFTVNIYFSHIRRQHFGMISNAFIRMTDKQNHERLRYTLDQDYNEKTFVTFATLKRDKNGWFMQALGSAERQQDFTLDHQIDEVNGLIRRFKPVQSIILTAFFFLGFLFVAAIESFIFHAKTVPGFFSLVGGLASVFMGHRILNKHIFEKGEQKLNALHKEQGNFIAQTALKILQSNKNE